MSTVFETAAIIRLVDELSGPLHALEAKVAAGQSRAMAAATKMTNVGREMTFALSLPIEELFRHLEHHAKLLSATENSFRGVIGQRVKTMGDLKVSTEEYTKAQLAALKAATDTAVAEGKGLVNPIEFQTNALAGYKALGDMNAAASVATQAVTLAVGGQMDQHDAADTLIQLGNQFGIATKNADGHAKSIAELNVQYGKLADLLVTMSKNSNMSTKEAAESLSLSAPIAKLSHMDPGVLGAMSEAQAESGYKGKEASVAQRALLMAILAPKASMQPALKAKGIDLNQYRHFNPEYEGMLADPEKFADSIGKFAYGQGLKVSREAAVKAYAKAQAEATAHHGAVLDYLPDEMIGVLRRTGKKESPVPPNLALKYVNSFLGQGVESVDMARLMLDMRDKHLSISTLRAVMEGRQIPRAASILEGPQDVKEYDAFAQAMKRAFGDTWEEQVRKGNMTPLYYGNAQIAAGEHAQGLEGSEIHMANATAALEKSLYDSGFWEGIARGIDDVAQAINFLSKANPAVIKGVAEGLVALAAIGPALWVGGKLISLASGITRFGAAVLGLAGIIEKSIPAVAPSLAKLAPKVAATVAGSAGTSAAKSGYDIWKSTNQISDIEHWTKGSWWTRMLGGAGPFLSKLAGPLSTILALRDIGELMNPTTKAGAPFRFDTYQPPEGGLDWRQRWERSSRVEAGMDKGSGPGMEAHRAEALGRLNAPMELHPNVHIDSVKADPVSVKVDPVEVKGSVSGEARLHITVDASGIKQTETVVNLKGDLGKSSVVPSSPHRRHRPHM